MLLRSDAPHRGGDFAPWLVFSYACRTLSCGGHSPTDCVSCCGRCRSSRQPGDARAMVKECEGRSSGAMRATRPFAFLRVELFLGAMGQAATRRGPGSTSWWGQLRMRARPRSPIRSRRTLADEALVVGMRRRNDRARNVESTHAVSGSRRLWSWLDCRGTCRRCWCGGQSRGGGLGGVGRYRAGSSSPLSFRGRVAAHQRSSESMGGRPKAAAAVSVGSIPARPQNVAYLQREGAMLSGHGRFGHRELESHQSAMAT